MSDRVTVLSRHVSLTLVGVFGENGCIVMAAVLSKFMGCFVYTFWIENLRGKSNYSLYIENVWFIVLEDSKVLFIFLDIVHLHNFKQTTAYGNLHMLELDNIYFLKKKKQLENIFLYFSVVSLFF